MSNSRYTLQVETNDDNLMYTWHVSMEARVPFTAWTVYEYYLSRSGMDQALRECRETMRRLEDTGLPVQRALRKADRDRDRPL